MTDSWESIMPRYRFPASILPAMAEPASRGDGRPVPVQCALEVQFPHILSAIQALWGFKELNTYFTKLTIDERGGRAGFPPEVWDEIHTLLRLHQEILPEPLFATNISRHALDFRIS
ncbi:MAG TPA: hypothetical protein DHV59_18525 [Oxalobacteraceae bacterium]|nr:hypothetical protein [Oxalobacteraceae bacterium]